MADKKRFIETLRAISDHYQLMDSRIQNIIDIQSQDGNWNYDAYMYGMLNGMLIIQAIIKDDTPEFKQPPNQWLKDKEKPVANEEVEEIRE